MEKQWTPDQSHVKLEDNFNVCFTPLSYTAGLAMAFTLYSGFYSVIKFHHNEIVPIFYDCFVNCVWNRQLHWW